MHSPLWTSHPVAMHDDIGKQAMNRWSISSGIDEAQDIQPHTARNYEFAIKGKAVDIPCFPEKSVKVC